MVTVISLRYCGKRIQVVRHFHYSSPFAIYDILQDRKVLKKGLSITGAIHELFHMMIDVEYEIGHSKNEKL